jgi:hypothetical protein
MGSMNKIIPTFEVPLHHTTDGEFQIPQEILHSITKHQQQDVRLLRRAGDDGSMDGLLFSMVSMWSDSETSKEL